MSEKPSADGADHLGSSFASRSDDSGYPRRRRVDKTQRLPGALFAGAHPVKDDDQEQAEKHRRQEGYRFRSHGASLRIGFGVKRPVVGISADLIDHNGLRRAASPTTYAAAVASAGGVPVLLPPVPETAVEAIQRCDGLVLTGGDDPLTEPFGEATDPRVTPVHADRQSSESAILQFLARESPDTPVLGVCLGMQMMALHAGGRLDQFMPQTTPTHADHWERSHDVRTEDASLLSEGLVNSKHKQAIVDAGRMRVIGVA
ncbi:MAG: gamma-glutamyl-gamma-aminobutyrate hydrolase family protein, partial [Planctomycetota bacterium]